MHNNYIGAKIGNQASSGSDGGASNSGFTTGGKWWFMWEGGALPPSWGEGHPSCPPPPSPLVWLQNRIAIP